MAGRTETRICEQCQQPFQFETWRTKQGFPGRFCSRECKGLSQRVDLTSRFYSNLSQPTDSGCIEWMGTQNSSLGYGRIQVGNGSRKMVYAHRLAWELANKRPIPKGLFVCHSCDNPRCVNPDHLFLGEPKDNSADMTRKRRQAAGERQGAAKLTAEKVREIIRLYSTGTSSKELAQRYGVTPSAIVHIVARKSWKHVTVLPQ